MSDGSGMIPGELSIVGNSQLKEESKGGIQDLFETESVSFPDVVRREYVKRCEVHFARSPVNWCEEGLTLRGRIKKARQTFYILVFDTARGCWKYNNLESNNLCLLRVQSYAGRASRTICVSNFPFNLPKHLKLLA